MTGAILLVPFLLVRFGLLSLLGGDALRRAAHFPPMAGKERMAYWLYQLATVGLFVGLCFLGIHTTPPALCIAGLALLIAGTALLAAAVVAFAAPSAEGIRRGGPYRFSRNPMYVAYFFYFLGCVLLTQSWVLLGILLVFQVTAHRLVLAEERWCAAQFVEAYPAYARGVRRYL